MKTKQSLLIWVVVLLTAIKSHGQDTVTNNHAYPTGITFEYGRGHYGVIDEYISEEKYTGALPYLSLEWAKKHDKYIYHFSLAYRNSDNIKNYNVASDITQFTLDQRFLYSLKKRTLFNKELLLWLGPTAEVFFYYNKQQIAVDGFDYTQSFAALLSAGIDIDGVYSLSTDFKIESSLSMTVLSLGIRMVDFEEEDQSPAKLLTPFNGLNTSFDLDLRYYLFRHLSVKAGYKFECCRISAWNPMRSASDSIVIGLTFDL